MDTTQNFGLKKSGANDFVDIDVLNENIDIIDEKCARESWYGACATATNMATKSVATETGDFKSKKGARLLVRFQYGNTVTNPRLKVDGGGLKYIKQYGTTDLVTPTWRSGEVVEFVYGGTYWIIVDGGIASTSNYGATKLSSDVDSEETEIAANSYAVKKAYDRGTDGINAANEAYALAEEVQTFAETSDEKWQRRNVVTIETSQNWTVPAGVYEVMVFLIGGGAAGCGASSAAGNGGAGGFAATEIIRVVPGKTIPIVIGAGGESTASSYGKSSQNFGGESSFGHYLTCRGGGMISGTSGIHISSGGAGGGNSIYRDGGSGVGDSVEEYGNSRYPGPVETTWGLGGKVWIPNYQGAFCSITNTLYGAGGGGNGGVCIIAY